VRIQKQLAISVVASVCVALGATFLVAHAVPSGRYEWQASERDSARNIGHNQRANGLRWEYEHGRGGRGVAHPNYAGHRCLLWHYTAARNAGLSHDDAYDAACGFCRNVC
jgi:hypothetical protein